MDVVDGDQHGLLGTAVEEGLLERAEQLEELVVGKAAPPGAAEELAHLAAEGPVTGLDLGGELLQDAERGGRLLRGAARPEHPHPGLAGDVAHRVHHRGLAQPGGAFDHDGAGRQVPAVLHQGRQLAQDVVAAHEAGGAGVAAPAVDRQLRPEIHPTPRSRHDSPTSCAEFRPSAPKIPPHREPGCQWEAQKSGCLERLFPVERLLQGASRRTPAVRP